MVRNGIQFEERCRLADVDSDHPGTGEPDHQERVVERNVDRCVCIFICLGTLLTNQEDS